MNHQKQTVSGGLSEAIDSACRKIAPLWPLSHFVAVNPFLGYSGRDFAAAAADFKRIQDADLVLPLAWFREKYRSGDIGSEDLRAAVAQAPEAAVQSFAFYEEPLSADALLGRLDRGRVEEASLYQTCSFSVYLDSRFGTHWQHVIREEAAKWCAAYDDDGQSSWKFPWKDKSLYAGWKTAASIDRNAEFNGLRGFRRRVAQFPDQAEAAVDAAVQALAMPPERIEELLYRILLTLPGWAGHLRYKDREVELRGGVGDLLVQLLAILLNYEVALYEQYREDENVLLGWRRNLEEDDVSSGGPVIGLDLAERLIWQGALEHAFEASLRTSILSGAASAASSEAVEERPEVQAVFCIDVRSELFRRALEGTSLKVRTMGFAGFFGLPIDHTVPGLAGTQARCPVLLAPPVKTFAGRAGLSAPEFETLSFERIESREQTRAWKRFKEAASSCFTFVETLGLGYVTKIIKDSFGIGRELNGVEKAPAFGAELPLADRIDLAMGILQGLGLKSDFARVVLFCGHGSETRNNPYGSGLDCGACGGHSGEANARLAAALLNDSEVRAGLVDRGIAIPAETRFLAGLHNTTTDEVALFDTAGIEAALIGRLRAALAVAGAQAAIERSTKLGSKVCTDDTVEQVRARGRDWSQVRPEWGLAGNAAFVVAPRSWTAASGLEGRVFLHDYCAADDPESAVLEQIIGGPLVVGSWINLQYYGSATDNKHFGSGHKSIHNVVGGVGVALGNENDLRPGLPLQSVHDGERLIHEPLRLHACIAAEPEALDQILARQDHVRELVENGWIHLISLGADGRQWLRRDADGRWRGTTQKSRPAV